MSNLTATGNAIVTDLARRYGLSAAAVEHMARAVANGGGGMAQFNIPELGGSGQWMAGGMTMVGDMFNYGLQHTVSSLCGELSNAMASTQFFERVQDAAGGNWWPAELGAPAATGGQNGARYAFFPEARRLAFDYGDGRPLVLLDTGDHRIGGFSQQQSGPGEPFLGVTVSSQFGQFALSSFQRAEAGPAFESLAERSVETTENAGRTSAPVAEAPTGTGSAGGDILGTIERLAKLRDQGALSEEEFSSKKAELLARL